MRRRDSETEELERQPLVGDDKSKDTASAAAAQKQKMLIISFLLMVVFALGNKIFQKLQTIPMHNYPYFLNLLTTFVYIPLSFAYIWPMIYWGSLITKEQREIEWYKFGIMGTLDGIAGLMQSFAVNYIPSGSLIILLTQSAIPISMAISRPLVKAKYSIQHYLGATIVVAGLVVVLVPQFTGGSSGNPNGESNLQIAIWCMVLILSCIPMTLSSVYKEKSLGETEIDVVYLNGWVAIYQFIVTVLLVVPGAYASDLTYKDIPDSIINGAKCYVGIDSITTGASPDDCTMAPLFVNLYLFFNVGYNILIIMILKYGSANLLWLAMTLMVPLGNFAFTLKFVPGHQSLKVTDIIGLVVIMAGLILYRFSGLFKDLYNKFVNGRVAQ